MHHAEHLPNVLLLDTSNQYCSVALQWRGQLTARHEWSEQKHSQMILPMVRELLAAQQATFADLDAIAVNHNPLSTKPPKMRAASAGPDSCAVSASALAWATPKDAAGSIPAKTPR